MMSSAKVLVVDDDPAIGKLVQTQLKMLELQAVPCSNIQVAKALLASQSFRFVLSDINMPGGSGIELANWVATNHPSLPFYLMTGHALELPAATLSSLQVLGVLRKPFQMDHLTDLICDHLDQAMPTLTMAAAQPSRAAQQL